MNDVDGNVEFQDVIVRVRAGRAGAQARVVLAPTPAPRRRSSARAARARARSSAWSWRSTIRRAAASSSTARTSRTCSLRDYRSHVGVVMQDNFLFDGTVRENIAFSKPGATDEEVRVAAHIAHCDEFVDRFEKGYDTIVGERGVKLSGGQRQRVAIARAVLADPRILILDEATSSLDSESEAMIRDGLRSLRRGRTTFVIAHRLSTIESADQILVHRKRRDRRARHAPPAPRARRTLSLSSTSGSTARRRTSSSTPAKTSSPSPGRTSFGSSDPARRNDP